MDTNKKNRKNRWLQFAAALLLATGFIAFLMSEPVPPGMAGDVIRRNLEADVQATALIYMDLEKMPDLEIHLVEMYEETAKKQGMN